GNPVAQDPADLVDVVLDDLASHAFMAGLGQRLGQEIARGVGAGVARIADRQDRAFQRRAHCCDAPWLSAVLHCSVRAQSAAFCWTQKLRPLASSSRFQNGALVFRASIMNSHARKASPRCALAAPTKTIWSMRANAPTRCTMANADRFQRSVACCASSVRTCSHMPG